MTEEALGVLETIGLTPAMVALDAMIKEADVHALQVELNDNYGVCLKIGGGLPGVRAALEKGRRIAEEMGGRPTVDLIPRLSDAARSVVFSRREFNPLIQQDVVFLAATPADPSGSKANAYLPPPGTGTGLDAGFRHDEPMNSTQPNALGFIETQGFTAAIEAVDTACKAAQVAVVGKEKLGGGYVTVVIEGELSAVEAAIAAGREKVEGLGKLIAAHVIARPQSAILRLITQLPPADSGPAQK